MNWFKLYVNRFKKNWFEFEWTGSSIFWTGSKRHVWHFEPVQKIVEPVHNIDLRYLNRIELLFWTGSKKDEPVQNAKRVVLNRFKNSWTGSKKSVVHGAFFWTGSRIYFEPVQTPLMGVWTGSKTRLNRFKKKLFGCAIINLYEATV